MLIEFPSRHYISRLKASSTGDFSILHLNINSVYLKRYELNEILDLQQFDIILLNETKLDTTVPESFIKNSNYKIIRYDRDRSGGIESGAELSISGWDKEFCICLKFGVKYLSLVLKLLLLK